MGGELRYRQDWILDFEPPRHRIVNPIAKTRNLFTIWSISYILDVWEEFVASSLYVAERRRPYMSETYMTLRWGCGASVIHTSFIHRPGCDEDGVDAKLYKALEAAEESEVRDATISDIATAMGAFSAICTGEG